MIDLAKKARAKNLTPMSLGVGDRPYPGAYLVQEVDAEKARRPGIRQPAQGQAVVDRPARAGHADA